METIQANVRDGLTVTLSDGRKLGYAEYGDPNGKPLLYFHGGISCRLDIAFAKEQLAAKHLKVIAPDRPGVGISDPKRNRSLLAWADDVEEFLDALNLAEIPVFGWSLGSAYVFPCLYKIPHRFSRVATIGSCAPFDSKEYIAELGLQVDRWLMTCPISMRWSIRAYLSASGIMPLWFLKREAEQEVNASKSDLEIVRSLPTEYLTGFLLGSMKQGADGVIDDYWAVRENWGFCPGDISKEISLFHGLEDTLAPMSGARRLNQLMSGSKLIEVPDIGHFLLHRKLDEVMESLAP